MSGEKFIFPIADGTVKFFGGDQVLRTSSLIRDRPDRGEEEGNVQKKNQTDLLQPRCMMMKLEMISGLYQAILFTVITWNPESNFTCRERHHSFIPLKCIDVTRATHTSLDVMMEKISTIIGRLMLDRE